ncbi:hypothetical protein STENM36S_07762 [Streptomyces tendae]
MPPRYDRGDWQEGGGVFNARAIAAYTRTLADRIQAHVTAGHYALVLGEYSIQLGAALALRRLAATAWCRSTPLPTSVIRAPP